MRNSIRLKKLVTGTRENVLHLFDHPQFELMRHDVVLPLYVEVDEICDLARPAPRESFAGPANLGSQMEFTVRELVVVVVEFTNSSSMLIDEPLPADDPQQCKSYIGLAKTGLGWKSLTSLREGPSKTVSYFEQMISDGLA